MMVYSTLHSDEKLTPEEIKMIEKAASQTIIYDDDCPESTPEQLALFAAAAKKRNLKHTVGLRLNQKTIEQYKKLGKGYTTIMAQALEYMINHPDLLKDALNN